MTKTLRQYCVDATTRLEKSGESFGFIYTTMVLDLYRIYKYKKDQPAFGLFSSLHSTSFFKDIIECLDGKPWIEKGEYGNNFRGFIKYHQKLEEDELIKNLE